MKSIILGISLIFSFLSIEIHAHQTFFTYQGRLTSGNGPATGTFDFIFSLFESNTLGGAIAGPITNSNILVTNGLFTTLLDFGSNVFVGSNRWLEIDIKASGDVQFVKLNPRQLLSPTPEAIHAHSASSVRDGAIGPAQIAPGSIGAGQLEAGLIGQLTSGSSQIFSNSASFIAPTNSHIIFVTLVGGGGGGGAGDQTLTGDLYGGGGGGSAGIVLNYPVLVVPGASYAITIGSGGAGAPSGESGGSPTWSGRNGSPGGNSSFANLVTANGGGGGYGGTGINQGGGGEGGGGGTTLIPSPFGNLGYSGNEGGLRDDNHTLRGGVGAASPFGTGGSRGDGANGDGGFAGGYGSGGGGGAPSDNGHGKGGNGSSGIVIIRY